jgi:hypothetical protein
MKPTKFVVLEHNWAGSQWQPRLTVLKDFLTSEDTVGTVAIFAVEGRMSNATAIAVVTEWLYRDRPSSMSVRQVPSSWTPGPARARPREAKT